MLRLSCPTLSVPPEGRSSGFKCSSLLALSEPLKSEIISTYLSISGKPEFTRLFRKKRLGLLRKNEEGKASHKESKRA